MRRWEDFQQKSESSLRKLEVTKLDETDTCLPASTGWLLPRCYHQCVRELGVNKIRRQV